MIVELGLVKLFFMKIKIICLAALLAIIISCRKSTYSDQGPSKKSNSQFSRLGTENDFESRKQMFGLMTPNERYILWRDHLLTAKNQFTSTNEHPKVELINELLSAISASIFDENSTAADVFKNYFLPAWQPKANTIFSTMELFDLTYDPTESNIGSREAPPEIGNGPGDGSLGRCWCHAGQSGYSCMRYQFPWGVTSGVCERVGECREKLPGCGTLWLFRCDGNHCNFG